jgi:hypothetical protein
MWTDHDEDRIRYQAVVYAVMKLWGFIKCGKFLNVMSNSEPMNRKSPSWRQS